MSQPASQRMGTHPTNATQHPGHIVLEAEGHAKRRTKVQMIADRQCKLEEQMTMDQAAACVDAPKPKCPHAHPIAKAAKPLVTSEQSMASGDVGARVTVDKVVGAKTKCGGPGGVLAAGANIENPTSDKELGAPPARGKGRKMPLKTPVRDAIQAVAGAESLINPSTQAHDVLFFFNLAINDIGIASQTPVRKFNLAGRIPDQRSKLVIATDKALNPPSNPPSKAAPSIQRSITSSSAPSSRLTKGSTVSYNSAPPLTPQCTPDSDDGAVIRHSHLYEDKEDNNNDDEENEHGFPQGTNIKITPMDFDDDNEEQLDNDNSGDFSMFLDVQEDVQARPAPLVNYTSESDTSLDSLVPPAYYVLPSLKRKITEEDLLSPSSEIEVLDGPDKLSVVVKKEPEPVMLWQTSAKAQTSVAVRQKDPALKRLKTSAAGEAFYVSIAPSSQATETPKIVLSRSQYRMKHLPDVCQTLGKWSSTFIPTLIYCIGNQDEVCAIKDNSLSTTLQLIWDAVYKGVPYMVTTDGPVIAMALQQLSEWRNSISTTTLVVFATFLRSQPDLETDEDHQQFSVCLLIKSVFLYGTIKEDGSKHMEPFQSDLIMQVLVQHHCAISGALAIVPGFTTLGHVKGALTLATSAAGISTISLYS
ncbi:hypothetical protein EV424DRAFT_1541525 [Suillus variegatus]|nr:hypothetical protein EV424DRAFT_1541525 [Suillus variegatus]